MAHYDREREADRNLEDQIRDDTLTLLLAYRVNQDLVLTSQMRKIRQCCEKLISRTEVVELIEAYSTIIRAIYDQRYSDVIKTLNVTESGYSRAYIDD